VLATALGEHEKALAVRRGFVDREHEIRRRQTKVVRHDERIPDQPIAVLSQRGNVLCQGNKAVCQMTKVIYKKSTSNSERKASPTESTRRQFQNTYGQIISSNDNLTDTHERNGDHHGNLNQVHCRSVVTLNLSRAAPALISYAKNILKRMTGGTKRKTGDRVVPLPLPEQRDESTRRFRAVLRQSC
jgi:hypothetical protein